MLRASTTSLSLLTRNGQAAAGRPPAVTSPKPEASRAVFRRSVGLGDHDASIHRLAGDDALAAAVELVDQRNVADRRLELFEPGIAGRVVLEVGHDELAAAPLGARVAQNGLDALERIGQHGVGLQ